MAVGITNAPELPDLLPQLEGRHILVNQELGEECRMTRICGSSCHLAWSHSRAGRALSPDNLLNGALESFGRPGAAAVRHWGLAAKEPLQYSSSVLQIARAWHDTSPEARPGTLGVLTAYARGLEEQSKTWKSTPLSWVLVSADPSGTSLHPELDGPKVMEAAVRALDTGGTSIIGVNTIISSKVPMDKLLEMGKRAERMGFSQLTIGGLYQPSNGRLEDTLTEDEIRAVINAVKVEFESSSMQIALSLSTSLFAKWAGGWPNIENQLSQWRLEKKISSNIILIAPNPDHGYFLRLRWDGQMLDHEDLLSVGVEHGAFGAYTPGAMQATLERFQRQQKGNHKLVLKAA